jgi:acyl dehydratase
MSEPCTEPRTFAYDAIIVGMKEERSYAITPAVYECFLKAFDDRNPIHVDEASAKRSGFAGRVMHGSLLNGFLSHFVGMYFPGRFSLLLMSDLRFSQACYLGDTIRLAATVTQKMDARKIIILDVAFLNLTQQTTAARGRIQVMFREEL